jgi:hypothetical protein
MVTIAVWADDPTDEVLNAHLDQQASVSATICERKKQRQGGHNHGTCRTYTRTVEHR